ncbi:uncharacterized protein LOC123297245 [Chrysoperla carnea]|uniref:uncharacterized protein LOC123297245 n=1 Tax=Chrysoperla carnea TaxID=189513 RepID=UPI001D05D903|nr:uncharacterized protein LOC123297245 [Chrysoperla carnea]
MVFSGGVGSAFTKEVLDVYAPYFKTYSNLKTYNFILLYQAYYCTEILKSTCGEIVGKVFGPGIDKLITLGLPSEKIEFMGHSAGAHVVAATIKNMRTPVKLLIGLDPSTTVQTFQRGLADFTLALRTDSTVLGNIKWTADLELIANKGIHPQPGCPTKNCGTLENCECSHLLAGSYWLSIVENQDKELFFGVKCNETECDDNNVVHITPSLREKGTYYFKTLDSHPYGSGLNGIKNIIPTKNSTLKRDFVSLLFIINLSKS